MIMLLLFVSSLHEKLGPFFKTKMTPSRPRQATLAKSISQLEVSNKSLAAT